MKVAVAFGGGGMKFPFLVGVWQSIVNAGHEIVEVHGVSAGALTVAMAVQGKLDDAVRLSLETMTHHVHRYFKGSELAWAAIRGKLVTLATHQRLRELIEQNIPQVFPAVMPGFVGAVDWDSGAYLSLAHTAPNWPCAVLGSATIPPPLWPPVTWHDESGRTRRLVDGGVRTQIPLMDIYDRIFSSQLNCDFVIAVPTSPAQIGEPEVFVSVKDDIRDASLRTVELLTNQVGRDDITMPMTVNHILAQLPTTMGGPRTEDGRPYKHVPTLIIRPSTDLGGSLETTKEKQRFRFDHGILRAKQELAEYGE